MKKVLLLFFALLLPILIYFFLRTFGKNEFNVPVLFADSVTVPVSCKQYLHQAPYHIADSVLQQTSWRQQDSITVFVFEDNSAERQHERKIHLARIFDLFKTEALHVIHIYSKATITDQKLDRLTTLSLAEDDFLRIRNCIFLLSPDNDAVIIDHQKRIRGQYNLTNRQDADRMIMEEMNILFKRY